MPRQLSGYLPSGSLDDTVLFNVLLTSSADLDALVTSGDLDSWTLLGSGATFSSAGFSGNGTGGLRIVLSDANADLLDSFCEIGLDVQTAYLCVNDATTIKSYGLLTTTPTEQRILDAYSSVAYANGFQVLKGVNSTLDSYRTGTYRNKYIDRIIGTTSVNNTWRPHSEMLQEPFTRIQLDRKPNLFSVAIDGVHATWGDCLQTDKQFKVIVIGTDRGTQYHNPAIFKNLTIAARDVVIPMLPALSKCVILGDSLVDLADMTNGYRTASPAFGVRHFYESRGVRFGQLYTSENAGYKISQLSAVVTAQLLLAPSVVMYRGLTNDVTVGAHPTYAGAAASWSYLVDNANPILTTTGADLLGQMERILGVNGNAKTTVEKVVLGNVPIKPSESGSAAYITAANNIVDAIVSHITTTYGAKLIAKADVFALTGGTAATSGTNPLSDVFADGTHFWPRWSYRMGKCYAEALARIL